MIRNLKALGLALAAVFALGAVIASSAAAEPAQFTVEGIGATETAKIKGGQTGTDTFSVGALPPLTCKTATLSGKAESDGAHFTSVTLEPVYSECHVVIGGIFTFPATVTMNGCAYTFNATKNTVVGKPFTADLTIECPINKKIEIHVYETKAKHEKNEPICTFDIFHQEIKNAIQLTNTPAGKITADVESAPVAVHNTILNKTCGEETFPISIYKGNDLLEATNEVGTVKNGSVS